MESSTKKRFSQDKKVDRISSLPNVLLHHILSFGDTLQVVQTCVLSKRWMDVWKSHPYLEFNFKTYSSIMQSDSLDHFVRFGNEDKMTKFTNFVYQVLVRRNNSKVVKLCFASRSLTKHSMVEALIYYAVKHHVEEIFIDDLCCYRPIILPRCALNCESLKSLKLKVDPYRISLPKVLGLPSLNTLHLAGAEDFDGKIFSSCPNLESLTIEDIRPYSIEIFNIHALKLKRLEILNWEDNFMDRCKVVIIAPKLTHLKFEGNAPLVWSEVNLTLLDDVNIDLQKDHNGYYLPDGDELEQLSLNLIKMLNGFQNAKSLTLSMNTIEVLSKVSAVLNEHPSPFTNLKYLKLKTKFKDVAVPAHILNYFLRSSSTLKLCF